MRSFLEVVGFELRLQLRSPTFAGMMLVFFAIHLLAMAQVGIHISDNRLIAYNSAYLIFRTELVLSLVGMAPAIFFVVNAATRDAALGAYEFFCATPVPRLSFLFGRFSGAVICALLVGLAGVLGTVAAAFMPWLDAERIAPFDWRPYAVVFLTLVGPNLLVFSAFAFSAAVLSRSVLPSFALALGFIVVGLVLNNPEIVDRASWIPLLDPFGGAAVERLVRYWTMAELNTVLPTALMPANRLLWLSLAVLAVALTAWRFRLDLAHAGKGQPRRGRKDQSAAPSLAGLQRRPGSFRSGDTMRQLASQWTMDLRAVLLSPLFWLIIALTIVSTLNEITSNVSALMDLPLHPRTSQMLGFLRYGMIQFVLVVIVIYAGILMHREREHRLHEIIGATPHPDWLPLVSKTLTLCTVLMLMLASSVLASVAWQARSGQYDFEPLVYLQSVFVFSGFYFCMLAVLACVLQVLTPGKWSGMLAVIVAMAVLLNLEPAGFEHLLYGFRIPFVVYSDMNGFGHFLTPTYSLMVYWGAFCALLLIGAHLLAPRGVYAGLGARLRSAPKRFTAPVRAIALAAAAVFLTAGGWIFYNTNVLNAYQTKASRLNVRAEYERRYAVYRDLPAPAVTAIDLTFDLYPKARRLQSSGRAMLRNTTGSALTKVFISADPRLTVDKLELEGGTLTLEDKRQGAYLFALTQPLAPGADAAMTWTVRRENRGFVNSAPDNEVVENGTFVDLPSVMPQPHYDGARELTDATDRKRVGLAPAPRLPRLGHPAWLNRIGFGTDSVADFHIVFGADDDQIAVAPGQLLRDWRSGDRRYFEYRMEIPTRPVISLSSARYQVARERRGGVDYEVYYDAKHPWNVRTMLSTSETALEYFSREFAPYPLSHFRLVEFPGYTTHAQAHAGTIVYSETVGFLNDLSDWAPLDYTTVHELAHQWWGGRAYGARMQGRQILNEGLAQYSTFMVFKQQPNPLWLRKILLKTHNDYLKARSEESVAEQPVILTEDQGYISYNKAALAMLALEELIGPEKMHAALRAYLGKFGDKPPPYPTSRDLIAEFRAVAGPEYQELITDLFEKIMLYDVDMQAVSVRRVGAEYEVTMDVEAHQFEANGVGKQVEVPLDTWFQVVVFPASDKPLLSLTPLYQQHHRLHAGKQRLVVRVPKAPGAAGVDPFHLMIDRTPENNTRRLASSG